MFKTVIIVCCDTCGEELLGNYDDVVVFDTEQEARQALQVSMWTLRGDQATCRRCARKAICEREGHTMQEWWSIPQDNREIEYRNCTVCYDHTESRDKEKAHG